MVQTVDRKRSHAARYFHDIYLRVWTATIHNYGRLVHNWGRYRSPESVEESSDWRVGK